MLLHADALGLLLLCVKHLRWARLFQALTTCSFHVLAVLHMRQYYWFFPTWSRSDAEAALLHDGVQLGDFMCRPSR